MKPFFRDRGYALGAVILVLFVVSLLQSGISYTIALGGLRSLEPARVLSLAEVLVSVRYALIVFMVVLWALKRTRALFRVVVFTNSAFTLALLMQIYTLLTVLVGISPQAGRTLILDVVLMALANILIFSIWYWIIDPPGVEEFQRTDEPWDFLFPQRAGGVPHYDTWVPHYFDYLFLAFTTSFAFSPTDALPLTRRAKMLMMLQAAISVVTITGIASSALNALAGSK